MDLDRPPVIVVDVTTPVEFESRCRELYEFGYKMDSSSCGFVNSEDYDFCGSYKAIFKGGNIN
mgnify:FL=1